MKKLSLLYFIFLFTICSFSQSSQIETRFWKLTSLNGELNLNSFFWDQKTTRSNVNERLQSSFLSGGLFLNSQSYFWHPNFLSLDLDVGYSPETGQYLSLVSPDRNEINTLKKLNVRAYIFKQNSLNLNVFMNINEGYNNRENLTNLKSNYRNYGSVFSYTNKYIPIKISYNKGKGEQIELQTDRSFITEHNNLEMRSEKSIGANDFNQIVYSHNKYTYNTTFSVSESDLVNTFIKNDITIWSMNNRIFLDSKKNYNFNSRVSNYNQQGNFNYKRFEISENLFFKLPYKFNYAGNYNFFDIKGGIQNLKQHDIRSTLSHQLYKSLRTNISFEYNNISDKQYKEIINRKGLNINYTKKTPLKGTLSLNYSLNTNQQERVSDDLFFAIEREEQTLSDNRIVLLKNQNINASTVEVNDASGTIIYRLNFDYLLIKRNELLEIQRIPGGQIANNEIVYINYIAIQPSSYKYRAVINYFNASVSLFRNKITFYYKSANQDFVNPVNIAFLTLDYFNQNVYGTRFNFNFISGGIEKDNYKSTIIPYRLTKYYLILQGNIKEKLFFTFNGDVRDYQMIVEEGIKQKYSNISGNISYNINQKTKLNIEGSYIKQEGEGVDLNLLTSRLTFTTRIRQLFLSTGVELYKSKLFNEKMDFNRFTIRLSRKF
ncbi:hypothetical protein Lupro_12520 [Lutibacter profundi]|uniref:Outer membrane protein beta-barrel domain-containing protein n=1 Tax=Lutibacter profundi TaxID=1622118 RepID=A0A0X8G8J7_9FLAO|nr:hypothetical protein [Lutibacter profundi]AMC12034.1 hypothetical protein Lupro_12520 [Lutibacter profundi]